MASGSHNLEERKRYLENRLEELVNQDLKEICRSNGYQVSGTKAVLQMRCRESELYPTTGNIMSPPSARSGSTDILW